MQFTKEGIKGSWRWDPKMTWGKAIQLPGASQMQHLRALIESRPFLIRIPDQGMIVSGEGRREDRVQATRASDGSYAFVYITTGGPVRIAMNRISGGGVTAYWYDPRRGTSAPIGRFANDGVQPFTPPTSGRGNDWVLVLDDAARNFGPPGAHER
jgi:hypothetical protein